MARVTAALAECTWRQLDAQVTVAELAYDSGAPVGGRTVRRLIFRAPGAGGDDVVLSVDVGPAGIVGQMSPASPGRVTARVAHRVHGEAPLDPVGLFTFGAPPPGRVRFYARTTSYSVGTCWVVV